MSTFTNTIVSTDTPIAAGISDGHPYIAFGAARDIHIMMTTNTTPAERAVWLRDLADKITTIADQLDPAADDADDDDDDGAPCCPDPDCGGIGSTRGCTFPGYADNH